MPYSLTSFCKIAVVTLPPPFSDRKYPSILSLFWSRKCANFIQDSPAVPNLGSTTMALSTLNKRTISAGLSVGAVPRAPFISWAISRHTASSGSLSRSAASSPAPPGVVPAPA